MLYSYKNTRIILNNEEFFANSAELSITNQVSPAYQVGDRFNTRFSAEGGINGSLRLIYNLTGNDILKDFIENETDSISGNFGGLEIQSGYLRNYSFEGNPNNPIRINAEIAFFDELKGQFSPTFEAAQNRKTFNFSDALISLKSGNSIADLSNDNVFRYSYNFSQDIEPIYVTDNRSGLDILTPYRVHFGQKTVTTDLSVDILSGDLPMEGKDVAVSIDLRIPDLSVSEEFVTRGILNSRNLSVRNNGMLQADLSVIQHIAGDLPTITGFIPSSASPHDSVIISGTNFTNATELIFNDSLAGFTVLSDTEISGIVPINAIDGKIKVINFVGAGTSDDNFDVIEPDIIVSGFSPVSGLTNTIITITGDNFYRIDEVGFITGTLDADSFSVLSANEIKAVVPDRALWGEITVGSSLRGKTGQSPYAYVPIPVINALIPRSGAYGDEIIISGQGFGDAVNNGDSAPRFNHIEGTVVESLSTGVRVTVPSTGNINGNIRIFVPSGVSTLSSQKFEASVTITGLFPETGKIGDSLNISGENFDANLLNEGAGGGYLVNFNNVITGEFEIVSDILLTGSIPSGVSTGPVKIVKPDGNTYPSSKIFTLQGEPPTIVTVNPKTGSVNDLIFIIGSGFKSTIEVTLSGVSGTTGGDILSSSEFNVDILGKIVNFNLPNLVTGSYDVILETEFGIDTGSGLLEVVPSTLPSIALSGAGPTGDINLVSFGNYEAGVDDTFSWDIHNTGDFSSRLTTPAISGYKFNNADSGDAIPLVIDAGSTETLTLEISDTGLYTETFRSHTGTFKSDDGYTGNFVIQSFFIIP